MCRNLGRAEPESEEIQLSLTRARSDNSFPDSAWNWGISKKSKSDQTFSGLGVSKVIVRGDGGDNEWEGGKGVEISYQVLGVAFKSGSQV